MNPKGIVAGLLLFTVVEVVLLFTRTQSNVQGTVGYNIVSLFRNGASDPMTWLTLVVFISVCSKFFQKPVVLP